MKVLYERVAGIDVHKKMIKVGIRVPGDKPWTRKSEVLQYRTFYGVLQQMAAELRKRGITHVVMEASGVYTEPVCYALAERDFEQVAVINPAHAKALKGHKTDARDCLRLAELFECGLLRGSYIPAPELKEVRDLTRCRIKTVQARTSEIQRLAKALESAGIKLGSVASDITGKSATAMIEALTGGERRGAVLADLARGRMRTAGKLADLSQALAGRFTDHHALLCRLHLDRIAIFDSAVAGLEDTITRKAARWQREQDLLKTIPGFGDAVAQAWLGSGQGPGAAAVKVPPAGPPLRRAEEPGREEEGDHRDRPHPAEDRLPGAPERPAIPGPGRRLLHAAGITRTAPGLPAAATAAAQPWMHHHHHPRGGRLTVGQSRPPGAIPDPRRPHRPGFAAARPGRGGSPR